MNFSEVLKKADEFTLLLNSSTNTDMVKVVTLRRPEEPMDELYFTKLVTWSYGFLVEAGQSAFREVGNLLKVSDPPAATRNGIGNKHVHDLRTVLTHNLAGDEKSSGYRARSQVDIWLLQNGGEPVDWEKCCIALCITVIDIIDNLSNCWVSATAETSDRENAVKQICDAVENKWAAHELDRILEEAADLLNIPGLDIVAYRNLRLKEWFSLSACFSNRRDAEAGLRRIIQAELKTRFL